jgi:hypothetical protein
VKLMNAAGPAKATPCSYLKSELCDPFERFGGKVAITGREHDYGRRFGIARDAH